MNSTALGAENIIFISEAHEKFFHEKLKDVRYQDAYHKALVYCLGICEDTRRNPFAQKAELAEKLDRLSALNALLNMDEKGDDTLSMDEDEPEAPKGEKEVADCPAKNIPMAEKAANMGQDKGIRQYADAPAARVSLKAKLEAMKVKVAGEDTNRQEIKKEKGKEEVI